MARTSLYSIIGVPETASYEQIRRAYLSLAGRLQAEADAGNRDSANSLKFATDAFSVIGNTERRKIYDDTLQQQRIISSSKIHSITDNDEAIGEIGNQASAGRSALAATVKLSSNRRPLIVGVLLFAIASTIAGIAVFRLPAEERQLKARYDLYTKAFESGDAEKAYALLAPTARNLISLEGYKEWLSKQPKWEKSHFVAIKISPDRNHASVSYAQSVNGKKSDAQMRWIKVDQIWFRHLNEDRPETIRAIKDVIGNQNDAQIQFQTRGFENPMVFKERWAYR